MNISKLKQQTKRQINYIDRLLAEGKINPNPIVGTSREKELKYLVEKQKSVIEQIEKSHILNQGSKMNQDVIHLSEKEIATKNNNT